MSIEYREMFGGKTKRDRQFEVLDGRLIDIQGRLAKIRQSQHDQIEMLQPLGRVPVDLALVKEELSLVHGLIFDLKGTLETMSSNIDRIEKEAADLAADVPVIKQALDDLKTLVADLKAQLAQGQLDQARLDAAAASLEKVDDDLDGLTAPPAPPEG